MDLFNPCPGVRAGAEGASARDRSSGLVACVAAEGCVALDLMNPCPGVSACAEGAAAMDLGAFVGSARADVVMYDAHAAAVEA